MDNKYDIPIAMVMKTNDYDKFKFISQNRLPDHVRALVQSFKDRYVPNAILCNDKFEIIDGQNRFLAAKELGLPVFYYCIENLGIYDVASLNSYGKNWSPLDFVNMWASLGKDEYKKILSFCKMYPDISLSSVLMILSDSVAAQQGVVGTDSGVIKNGIHNKKNKLKSGEFEIKDIEHAHLVATSIIQYKPFVRPGVQIYKQSAFVSAMVQLLRKPCFENSEMVRKAGIYPSLFYRCVSAKEYVLMLENLWNYKRRTKVRFLVD